MQSKHASISQPRKNLEGVFPAPCGFNPTLAELPNDTSTVLVLQRLATYNQWSQEEFNLDMSILEQQRLRTVSQLRFLSDEGWKALPLLPLVKDLLKDAIWKTIKSID